MRLRIRTLRAQEKGDGRYVADFPTGLDVIVEDADTGERLDGVQAVTWELAGPTDPVAATVTFIGAEIDADVDTRYVALTRAAPGPKPSGFVLGTSRPGIDPTA